MYLFFCNTTPTCNHLQLGLCWAITMHKSQGQTLDNAVIDLGPKETCTGPTFVCLSRVKRLVDLMVELMSFDRIGNLGNSSTMKARLQEEVFPCRVCTEHEGKVRGHGRLQRRRA